MTDETCRSGRLIPILLVLITVLLVTNLGVTSLLLKQGKSVPTAPTRSLPCEAVPVRFVTVPDEGVPNTPPLITGAPAVPTLTAKAVATPVPSPAIPVLMGKPVALVSVAD